MRKFESGKEGRSSGEELGGVQVKGKFRHERVQVEREGIQVRSVRSSGEGGIWECSSDMGGLGEEGKEARYRGWKFKLGGNSDTGFQVRGGGSGFGGR